jgi:hypothetical protein
MPSFSRAACALLALFLLPGCAEMAARGVTYSTEAVDAAKDLVDEKTDRREALRVRLYALEDRLLDCYGMAAMVTTQEPVDCGHIEAAVRQAASYIDEVYPDLAGVVDEIEKLRAALTRLRAS